MEVVISHVEPVLEIKIEKAAPVRFPLRSRRIAVGQSPFNDLTLKTPELARCHFELRRSSQTVELIDHSGDGIGIKNRIDSRHTLKSGDSWSIGNLTFTLRQLPTSELDDTGLQTQRLSATPPPVQGVLTWGDGARPSSWSLNGSVLIGAGEDAHIRLDDAFISNRHAQLIPTAEGMVLRDLNSTNGTWIGDVRIREAVLPESCTIRIGCSNLHFSGGGNQANHSEPDTFFGMIGQHPHIIAAQQLIKRIAPLTETVLILGETGTGKELAARAIHELGGHSQDPFIAVNCGALSPELVESELFGHEKGAFTGAGSKRRGAFVAAGHGTVFLDEVGELPLALQPKLLRALDSQEIKAVGSDRNQRHHARIVTATNRDLAKMVRDNLFREDLYYRLCTLPLRLPPLRERREDILLLAEFFLAQAGAKLTISDEALEALRHYYWPGNVRELRNILTASLCYHPETIATGILDEPHLALEGPGTSIGLTATHGSRPGYAGETLQQVEALLIREALEHYDGNKRLTSRALGISKSALYEKIKRYQIDT